MKGMITKSNSGHATQSLYAETLPAWTTTKLLTTLAKVRAQLENAYLGSFADECDLSDFGLGIMTELKRRGAAYPS